jgi:hypothetical protein
MNVLGLISQLIIIETLRLTILTYPFKMIMTYLFKKIEIVTYPFRRIMTYLFKKIEMVTNPIAEDRDP